jgi:hypothetical protein
MIQTTRCRLCDAESSFVFTLPVLGRYQVQYYQCRRCGSLQTEEPYWLPEAYGDDVHPEDRGYLKRNLLVYENMKFMLRVLTSRARQLYWTTAAD